MFFFVTGLFVEVEPSMSMLRQSVFETTQQPNSGQKILETHLNYVSCCAIFGSSVWERYVLPPLYVPTPH